MWQDERIQELGIKKKEVELLMSVLSDKIATGLVDKKKIKIKGLFTLGVRKVKGRKIAHPQTHEPMYIDDYYRLHVSPSKNLKEQLKKLD